MKKSDIIKAYKAEGITIPFRMLLDVYSDDEDVPDSFIKNVLLYRPRPTQHIFVMGEGLYKAFDESIKEYNYGR